MDNKEFSIVYALAIASMKHPNNAIKHHIRRLAAHLVENNQVERGEKLTMIIERPDDIPNVKPVLSN